MLNSNENNEEPISNNEESNRPACAACKHQRKKCKKGCPFLLHFPANRHQEFSAVHQIFGIANMNKMMRDIDLVKQGEVVESIIWEAMVWTNKDHKEHGPYGLYKKLEEDYKRLQEENKQLKEQLLKSHQLIQPKSPGVVSKSSWQGDNSSTNVNGLSTTENYPGQSHGNENLLLNSTVNNYSSLLEGYSYERETQGSSTPPELGFPGTSNGMHPPGLGFPGLARGSFFFRPEQEHLQMREGRQEEGYHHDILPTRPGEAMLPQSLRPLAPAGQILRRSQLENMNISNYSGPPGSSLESRRLSRYLPYSLPQRAHDISMQKNGFGQQYPLVKNNTPLRGFSQQYPLANCIQNNVEEQYSEVKSETKEEDNAY